jgi:hypothetical protein
VDDAHALDLVQGHLGGLQQRLKSRDRCCDFDFRIFIADKMAIFDPNYGSFLTITPR